MGHRYANPPTWLARSHDESRQALQSGRRTELHHRIEEGADMAANGASSASQELNPTSPTEGGG
jgi:hypothetical protein